MTFTTVAKAFMVVIILKKQPVSNARTLRGRGALGSTLRVPAEATSSKEAAGFFFPQKVKETLCPNFLLPTSASGRTFVWGGYGAADVGTFS